MLRCSKCKQEKDENEFYKSSSTSSWYRWWCKACCSEANKTPEHKELVNKRRKNNLDRVREHKRKTYYKYHEESLARKRKYVQENKEKVKESKKKTIAKKPHYYALYKVFRWIKDRCENQNNKMYYRYWWRWIKCLRETFKDFYNDMYDGYLEHWNVYWFGKKYTQLDRIDNNWHYCKENCRRVTAKENNPHNKAKEILSQTNHN